MSLSKLLLSSAISCCYLHAQTTEPAATPEAEYTEDFSQQSPNIILIIADDMGTGDFSSAGNNWIQTPHLDALAKNSVRWENFYVSPVGALTRASLHTGRYNIRTKTVDTSLGRSMMASDEVTLAEAFQGAGYKTGLFGKWHLGSNYPMRPSDQGFDTALTYRGNQIAPSDDASQNQHLHLDPVLLQNNREVATTGYATDIFFNAAKDFIKEAQDHQNPFFVTIAANTPQAHLGKVPEESLNKYKGKDLSAWGENSDSLVNIAAVIDHFDSNIGQLTALLKEGGALDNTIIVFVSDNGPNTKRFNLALRGQKESLYEGGVRSPLWIHWPQKVAAGRSVSTNNAAHIDIMPTLLDAAGFGEPEAFEFDGRSLLSQITTADTTLPERPVVLQWHQGTTPVKHHHFMVRKGDWKLLNPSNAKSHRLDSKNYELYDLSKDPSEATNLAKDNSGKVEELLKHYEQWYQDVSETRIRSLGTPYILVDSRQQNPLVLTWQDRISHAWGYTEEGFWKLFFERSTRCDVRLEFPENFDRDLTGWTADLTIGKKDYTETVASKSTIHLFRNIDVNKGRNILKASFTSPDGSETLSAFLVRLTHR